MELPRMQASGAQAELVSLRLVHKGIGTSRGRPVAEIPRPI
jgi:hypothetical protein